MVVVVALLFLQVTATEAFLRSPVRRLPDVPSRGRGVESSKSPHTVPARPRFDSFTSYGRRSVSCGVSKSPLPVRPPFGDMDDDANASAADPTSPEKEWPVVSGKKTMELGDSKVTVLKGGEKAVSDNEIVSRLAVGDNEIVSRLEEQEEEFVQDMDEVALMLTSEPPRNDGELAGNSGASPIPRPPLTPPTFESIASNDDELLVSSKSTDDDAEQVREDEIRSLEQQGRETNQALEEERLKLARALEEKERVAAEYSYLIQSYEQLKADLASMSNDWLSKIGASDDKIKALESRLEDKSKAVQNTRDKADKLQQRCEELTETLNEYADQVRGLQKTIDGLKSDSSLVEARKSGRQEERQRNIDNLQTLSDEYDALLERKQKKINTLRTTLRSANVRKRRLERNKDWDRLEIRKEVSNSLKSSLNEKEAKIRSLSLLVESSEKALEERDGLVADIMNLKASFDELQCDIESNTKQYDETLLMYQNESKAKDVRIKDLEDQLALAKERIEVLEREVESSRAELVREKAINANLTSTVAHLEEELKLGQTNAAGYETVVGVLKKESESLKSDAQTNEMKQLELEALLEKTRDSLVVERERVIEDMKEKDEMIAQLDRDLADKLQDAQAQKAALKRSDKELSRMTGRYDAEKERADSLERKIQKLNQLSPSGANLDISKQLEEVTKKAEEYKELVSSYEEKTTFLSQQLILSGQAVANKQARLETLQHELGEATADAATIDETKSREALSDESSELKVALSNLEAKSDQFKLEANEQILDLTKALDAKQRSLLDLQAKLDQQSNVVDPNLEQEVSNLKKAVADSQANSKEKLLQKNESIKQLEDSIAELQAELSDLKHEKSQLGERLDAEMKRSEDSYVSYDTQLKATKARMAQEKASSVQRVEAEMKETIHQLESEVKTLSSKLSSSGGGERRGLPPTTDNGYLKILEMEGEVRRSKDAEVKLIQSNMRMQHRIQELELGEKERSDEAPGPAQTNDGADRQALPNYYKDSKRTRAVAAVSKALRQIFRRKKSS